MAVDFEGVDLCRTGELCLVQMTCSDDPSLVCRDWRGLIRARGYLVKQNLFPLPNFSNKPQDSVKV